MSVAQKANHENLPLSFPRQGNNNIAQTKAKILTHNNTLPYMLLRYALHSLVGDRRVIDSSVACGSNYCAIDQGKQLQPYFFGGSIIHHGALPRTMVGP